MISLLAFALYLCLSCLLLIVAPVMMHPTLPMRRKILITLFSFFVLVPLALGIYTVVGAPQMATLR